MFESCLHPNVLNILRSSRVAEILRLHGFYLAGGTGLALQLGHRISDDLDFFSHQSFNPEEIVSMLGEEFPVTVIGEARGTLHILYNEDVKISFFLYPYRLGHPLLDFKDCFLADYRDIAAMKLVAVSQRGSKKDFVDLYAVLKPGKMSILQLKELVELKFTSVRYSWLHLIKSIGYFNDAEDDPMPVMVAGRRRALTDREWRKIKEFLAGVQCQALAEMHPH